MTSILKVDEIQSKNGTSALTIDSSGRILQPAKPAFKMELNVEGSAANYSSATVFLPDTIRINVGGGAAITGSQGQYTVPITGIYMLMYQINLVGVTGASYVDAHLLINGSVINGHEDTSARYLEDPQGGNYIQAQNSALFPLTANDVVTVRFQVVGDTSFTLRDGSVFSGFLVS
jgi:hypothetical protein